MQKKTATLILEDGSRFEGTTFGASLPAAGEVVFNTGMVGYPEGLTDPSYAGQILVATYPLMGNYGVPPRKKEKGISTFFESSRVHVRAFIVSECSATYSHFQATRSLDEWLSTEGVTGIEGIDTRALTKKLRERGVMLGKIHVAGTKAPEWYDPNKEILASAVSVQKPVTYGKGKKHVVAIDLGMKENIIRSFLARGVRVTRVPWNYPLSELSYDGLFISNGPGDPKSCTATIQEVREAMKKDMPIFGICFGNQILALAAGGDTYKLKYGHRSQNQPCVEVGTKRCVITSQNHGFAVNAKKLPRDWHEWYRNGNDDTNEGIRHARKPWFSVQFHPEASPGPTDTTFLFDEFVKLL